MNRLNVNQARCEALFASGLQRSDTLTDSALTEVISRTVRQLGIGGCISLMAQEFGDHPEAAAERMRWVRHLAMRRLRRARPDRQASAAGNTFIRAMPAGFSATTMTSRLEDHARQRKGAVSHGRGIRLPSASDRRPMTKQESGGFSHL